MNKQLVGAHHDKLFALVENIVFYLIFGELRPNELMISVIPRIFALLHVVLPQILLAWLSQKYIQLLLHDDHPGEEADIQPLPSECLKNKCSENFPVVLCIPPLCFHNLP